MGGHYLLTPYFSVGSPYFGPHTSYSNRHSSSNCTPSYFYLLLPLRPVPACKVFVASHAFAILTSPSKLVSCEWWINSYRSFESYTPLMSSIISISFLDWPLSTLHCLTRFTFSAHQSENFWLSCWVRFWKLCRRRWIGFSASKYSLSLNRQSFTVSGESPTIGTCIGRPSSVSIDESVDNSILKPALMQLCSTCLFVSYCWFFRIALFKKYFISS